MKILALIPARGGSKRLPGKNIKLLGGVPLIAWTIGAANECCCCIDVIVSTDDVAIAEISRKYGAQVPWMRPMELSTDNASSVDVAIHALDEYEAVAGSVDGLLLLQPTSPFRTAATIKRAVEIFKQGGFQYPVVSVSQTSCHPAWSFYALNNKLEPFLGWENINQRSQDLSQAWMLDGSIYLIAPQRLRSDRTFLSKDMLPIFNVEISETIDIDNYIDWMLAEAVLAGKNQPNELNLFQ